jgi:hypothetical protein
MMLRRALRVSILRRVRVDLQMIATGLRARASRRIAQ